ncbi:MAG TPA: ATP-dependent helicase [Thermoplasmatales archaeon]|nr:ATP-dependent helicase [Thermoplasmatales archaeon]
MRPLIRKVKGLPGTGKTTWMKNDLLNKLNDGYELVEILFTSFSRATMKAVTDKLIDTGFKQDDVKKRCRTLHSFAARNLELKKDNFVGAEHYEEFCKARGIPYKKFKVKTLEEIEKFGPVGEEYHDTEGNIIFKWFQLLKKACIYDKKVKEAILEMRYLTQEEMKRLSRHYSPRYLLQLYVEWEQIKHDNGLWEYDDMLQYTVENTIPLFGELGETRCLYIDEAQDLSPLQFELIKLWSKNCREVILAYDPNQGIFYFNAANPWLVSNLDGELIILPQSHRVPRQPWEYATRIAEQLGERDMGNVKPRDVEGIVLFTSWEEPINLFTPSSKTFLLFRTHWQIEEFVDYCFKNGVYILGMGRFTTIFNSKRLRHIYNLVRKLYTGEPLNNHEIKTFINAIPASHLRRGVKTEIRKMKSEQELDSGIKTLAGFFNQDDTHSKFYSLFKRADEPDKIKEIVVDPKTKLSEQAKRIIESVTPKSLPVFTNIRAGTYFASKGLEAENVFCFDFNPRRDANLRGEMSLAFVGTTRTTQNLYIVSRKDSYGGFIHDLVS